MHGCDQRASMEPECWQATFSSVLRLCLTHLHKTDTAVDAAGQTCPIECCNQCLVAITAFVAITTAFVAITTTHVFNKRQTHSRQYIQPLPFIFYDTHICQLDRANANGARKFAGLAMQARTVPLKS